MARLRQLDGLILDCDGVLTPGDLIYDEHGTRLLRFFAKDGLGLAMLCRTKITVAVLSGRPIDIATERFRELGVARFVGGCHDKATGVVELCADLGLDPKGCAFVGDDLPDLGAFLECGIGIAVADAASEVRKAADWITRENGGRGAVREICETILRARNEWDEMVERFGSRA